MTMELANQQQQQQALAKPARAPLRLSKTGVELETFEDAWRLAQAIAVTPFKPKGFESPESVLIAMMFARSIGIDPITGIQNIAVINGRPTVWGDALKALVVSSPECEWMHEEFEGTYPDEDFKAICTTQRRGRPSPTRCEFSIADAMQAGLWQKPGPWQQYPKRMLQMRARGFCIRDEYPDLTKGVYAAEEMEGSEMIGQATAAATAADRINASTKRVEAAIQAMNGEADSAAQPEIIDPPTPRPAKPVIMPQAKSPIEMAQQTELAPQRASAVTSATTATPAQPADFVATLPTGEQMESEMNETLGGEKQTAQEPAAQVEQPRRPGRPKAQHAKPADSSDPAEKEAREFSDKFMSPSQGIAWLNGQVSDHADIVTEAKIGAGVVDYQKSTLEQIQRICYLVKLAILRK